MSKPYRKDINFSYNELDKFDKIDKDIAFYLLSSKMTQNMDKETLFINKFLHFLYNDYNTKSAISLMLDLLDNARNSFVVVEMIKILGLKYY